MTTRVIYEFLIRSYEYLKFFRNFGNKSMLLCCRRDISCQYSVLCPVSPCRPHSHPPPPPVRCKMSKLKNGSTVNRKCVYVFSKKLHCPFAVFQEYQTPILTNYIACHDNATYLACRVINNFLLLSPFDGNRRGVQCMYLNTHIQKNFSKSYRTKKNRPQKTLQKFHYLTLNQCIGFEVMFRCCFIAESTKA